MFGLQRGVKARSGTAKLWPRVVVEKRQHGEVPCEAFSAPPNEAYKIHCGKGGVSLAGKGGRVNYFAEVRKRSPNVATNEGTKGGYWGGKFPPIKDKSERSELPTQASLRASERAKRAIPPSKFPGETIKTNQKHSLFYFQTPPPLIH